MTKCPDNLKKKNNKTRLNFIRLLRVVITPSVTTLLRGENDSKQSDEFQAETKQDKNKNVLLKSI